MRHLRHPLALLGASLALGATADWLFHDRQLGLNGPLFVVGLLLTLAAFARAEGFTMLPANSWIGGAALLVAAIMAVRDAPLLVALSVLGGGGLLLLHATLFAAAPLRRLEGWRVVVGSGLAACEAAILPLPLALRQVARFPLVRRSDTLLVIGRGALLAAPVLLVFTGLLAMADSVFASYVADVFALRLPFDVAGVIERSFTITLLTWAVAGCLLIALREHATDTLLGPPPAPPAEGETQRLRAGLQLRFLGWGEALTVLVLVVLLFASFMLIQSAYLFGGLDTLERTGLTFAEYARRGFFELVTVACLSLGLLWALSSVARREGRSQIVWFNALSVALVALVLGMLASAALRMWLYEQAFGFTVLRLLTFSLMAWLAAILLLFVVALLSDRPRLFSVGLPAAAVSLVLALALLNPDAMVARENLERYRDTGKLDIAYLLTLSDDATPILAAALPELGPSDRDQVVVELRLRRERLAQRAAEDGWPAWNLARSRALAALP